MDGGFDYIISADVLEHLYDPNILLRDLRAKLAPGGKLIASLPNSGDIYFRAASLWALPVA
jgi:2-polyprenyl-3-methyl-5-hydroxy-6-metoxy-1,4-benzoquinol methylase